MEDKWENRRENEGRLQDRNLTRNHNKECFGQNWSVLLRSGVGAESGVHTSGGGVKWEKRCERFAQNVRRTRIHFTTIKVKYPTKEQSDRTHIAQINCFFNAPPIDQAAERTAAETKMHCQSTMSK